MYEPFILQCVVRRQYALMRRGYEAYRSNSLPCRRGVTNQCAVRMSIALGRAGFGLETFTPPSRVHTHELAKFLESALGAPTKTQPQRAFSQISGQTGSLYFNNCFTRAHETARSGDHIDLFNGARSYNEIIHPQAGRDKTTGGSLFGRSDKVWFWPLA